MAHRATSAWRRLAVSGVLALLLGGFSPAAQGAPRVTFSEAENVRAFARLYGALRYFYPADAAAEMDWQRFAVHGVAKVRPARDVRALSLALHSLVTPLGPGIVVAAELPPAATPPASDQPLLALQYLGPGFSSQPGPYLSRRVGRPLPATIDGFITLMQSLPADALRGKTVRLRGRARVASRDGSGQGAFWLRVDRPSGMGHFDNMGNRPIKEAAWSEYVLEGPVADDAVRVAFGVMASGAASADFDAVDLAARDTPSGDWKAIPLADPGFESGAAGPAGWFRAGNSKHAVVSWPGDDAPEGARFLRLAAASGGAAEPLFGEQLLKRGQHADVDLGSGLRARVPIVLTDGEARTAPSREPAVRALRQALLALPSSSSDPDLDTRLADVVVAWNVYRHFYPYWPEAGVDWDARLVPLLEAARSARTRAEQRDVLRRLVAEARDGHGGVRDVAKPEPQGSLPLQLALIEEQLVVTASAEPAVPVGSVVTRLDGNPVGPAIQRALALASGSTQWKRTRALSEVVGGAPGVAVRLQIEDGRGAREVTLERTASPVPAEKRPQPVSELAPGIFYVDLTRAAMSQIEPVLQRLAAAGGVVFDVRGYPTGDAHRVLPHLIEAAENARWMHVPRVVGPFGLWAGAQSEGWNLQPATPRVAAPRVFLTDGRAISYAESMLGYVADLKLGRLVGGPTAGTNGNVATFEVPSGFSIAFTGMRVTHHDGQTPFHLTGVRPDVAIEPTIAGLRAGRDEVLEKGLELLRSR